MVTLLRARQNQAKLGLLESGAAATGICHDGDVDMLQQSRTQGIVLMADPQVTDIQVSDIGEDLVDLRALGFCVSPLMADEAGAYAHVRAGLAERLRQASSVLPDGLQFLIFEGHRPLALQRRYFERRLGTLRAAEPSSDPARLHLLASQYVSPPGIAPHSAGAAIDLTLCTGEGRELDLGTPYDATPEESGGACFTGHSPLGETARRNRSILGKALRKAGFVNYPTEWWHWSYGDRYWAMITGASTAIYGPYDMQRLY